MNMNRSEPNLVNTKIPPNFLTKVHIGRCAFGYKGGCTTPGGLFTDFNVWDRAFSEEEAIEWTACRSNEKGNILNWEKCMKILKSQNPFTYFISFDSSTMGIGKQHATRCQLIDMRGH